MKRTLTLCILLTPFLCSVAAPKKPNRKNPGGIRNQAHANASLMDNHNPQSQLDSFKLRDGYEVNLFASTPMLGNPVHMNWDAEGRLWVACSWAYPQVRPGEKPNDKIIVLEDHDGDGRADKSTVFADQLYIPTGLELANKGVYVAQAPDIVFLEDTDGDLVADERRIEMTGFGIEDSHHSISAWKRGPGGWIYFQEGIFLNTQVETRNGLVRLSNGGVFQYNPRTQDLRVFARAGGGNPWGHLFDQWGQSFQMNNPRVVYLTPTTGNGKDKVGAPVIASSEKQCGGDVVSGSHMPEDIQGQLLACRFKSGAIIRYRVFDQGSGFGAGIQEPLIRSTHPNFRPVDVKMGPDGAIYIADWYNPIINHAGHDFRDPRRNTPQGRIWRITAKGRPLVKRPKIAGEPIPALLAHLKSPDTWTRHFARLELSERDRDPVLPALRKQVEQLDENDPKFDLHLVELMWAFQNLDTVDEPVLRKVLRAQTGEARAAGARTLRYWHQDLSDPLSLLRGLASDPYPRVRLEGILSAGFIPDARALPIAVQMYLDGPGDKFLDLAMQQTMAALSPLAAEGLANESLAFAKPEHRTYALGRKGRASDSQLTALLRKGGGAPADYKPMLETVARSGGLEKVGMLTKALASKTAYTPGFEQELYSTLEVMARRSGMGSPRRELRPLYPMIDSPDSDQAIRAIRTLGAWRDGKAEKGLTNVLKNQERPEAVREAAAIALGQIGSKKSIVNLEKMAAGKDLVNVYPATLGLVAKHAGKALPQVAGLLARDPGDTDRAIRLASFIIRQEGGADLMTRAIEQTPPHPAVRTALAAHFRKTGQLPPDLMMRLDSGPTSATASMQDRLVAEGVEPLADAAIRDGDPYRGELVFRTPALACISCHPIGGAGPKIGPDLGAAGSAAPPSYMVDSILFPNKAIAEHYQTASVITKDGRAFFGIAGMDDDKKIIITDSVTGKPSRILRDEIKTLTVLPSLMPPGLINQLSSRQQFLDLVAFLSRTGKQEDFTPSVKAVARTWEVKTGDDLDWTTPIESGWFKAYSLVRGELPAPDFQGGSHALIRTSVEVQQAGQARVQINDTTGLSMRLNGKAIPVPGDGLSFEQGVSEFTILIDTRVRGKSGLSLELVPDAKKPATLRMVM